MRKYLMKAVARGLCCLCIPALFLSACSGRGLIRGPNVTPAAAMAVFLTAPISVPILLVKNAAEDIGDSAAQRARRREMAEATHTHIRASCPEGYGDFCYRLRHGSSGNVAAGLEEMKPFPLHDPRTYYMLSLLADPASRLSRSDMKILEKPLTAPVSQSDMMLRAALLRRGLAYLWAVETSQKRWAILQDNGYRDSGYGYSIRSGDMRPFDRNEAATEKADQALRQRPAPPNPEYQALVDHLWALDQAMLDARPNRVLYTQDELVLGADAEMRAWFGPESEFQPWVDQAKKHYKNVIRSGDRQLAVVALVRHDGLTADEAQRVETIQLFIKHISNQAWLEPGDYQPLDELTFGRDIQSAISWAWPDINRCSGWAQDLDEALQKGQANKEISTLMAEAYPRMASPDGNVCPQTFIDTHAILQ